MIITISLLAGLFIWWFLFGIECFINGAHGGWELPFVCFYDDVIRRKAPYGWIHGTIMHIIVPLFPLAIAALVGLV